MVSRRTGRPATHPPARQKPWRWCRQGGRRHSPSTRSPVLRPILQRVIIPSVALCRCHGNVQCVLGRLREAFLGGDRATAGVYLQNLVDHIVVGEDEIVIEARAGAALAMMSASGTTPPEATKGEVLADVVDWRRPKTLKAQMLSVKPAPLPHRNPWSQRFVGASSRCCKHADLQGNR